MMWKHMILPVRKYAVAGVVATSKASTDGPFLMEQSPPAVASKL